MKSVKLCIFAEFLIRLCIEITFSLGSVQIYCYYVQKNCLFWASCRNITVHSGPGTQGVPGFPCRAIFGVCEEILVFRRNIHLWTLCHRPSIHPQGVCSGFLDSLDQLLKVEGVESMGDVVAALLSAQSHLWKKSCCVCPSGTAV